MIFEELKREDVDKATDLLQLCFPEHTRDTIQTDLKTGLSDYTYKPIIFVAKENDRVIALRQALPAYFHGNTYLFAWFAVHPDHQGKGIGQKLAEHVENYVAKEKLKGLPGTFMTVAAHRTDIFEKMGYKPQAIRTHDNKPLMIKTVNVSK